MTQSPLEPLILRLAVPAIVSNLVTVTYNMADTWFIGRLGTSQSGAVGVAFSVMTIMQAIGFFFGQGGGNSLSRELGKRNEERASRLLSVAFFGSVGFGVLLGVLGLLVLQPLVHGLGATDTIAPYAVQYLTPLLVATPCVTGSFTMNGLLRFQGLSAYSMIGLVTGAILNIALAPALIFGAGLGIFGAGLATAICQTISFTILGVARQGLFLVPLVWLLPAILPAFGLPALLGIQMAQPISDLLTFAITVPIQLRMLWGAEDGGWSPNDRDFAVVDHALTRRAGAIGRGACR